MDRTLGDSIPTFNKKPGGGEGGVSLSGGLSALVAGGGRTRLEIAVIILVAGVIVGGTEFLLGWFQVPQYVLPKPSLIVWALVTEFKFIWPHLLTTLYELFVGFAIGGSIGFILAAVITQFPFVEKVVTPYILLLVTTPMLALVPRPKIDREQENMPPQPGCSNLPYRAPARLTMTDPQARHLPGEIRPRLHARTSS